MPKYIKSVKYNGGQDIASGNILINGTYSNGVTFTNEPLGEVTINGITYSRRVSDVPDVVVSESSDNSSFTLPVGTGDTRHFFVSGGFGSSSYGGEGSEIESSGVHIDYSTSSGGTLTVTVSQPQSSMANVGSTNFYIPVTSQGYGVDNNGSSGLQTKSENFKITYEFYGASTQIPSLDFSGFEFDSIIVLYSSSSGGGVKSKHYPAFNDGLTGLWYDDLNSSLQGTPFPDVSNTIILSDVLIGEEQSLDNALSEVLDAGTNFTMPLFIFEGDLWSRTNDTNLSYPEAYAIYFSKLRDNTETTNYTNVHDLVHDWQHATFLVLGESIPGFSNDGFEALQSANIKVVGIDVTVPIDALSTLLGAGTTTQYPIMGSSYSRVPYSISMGSYEVAETGEYDYTLASSDTLYTISGMNSSNMITLSNSFGVPSTEVAESDGLSNESISSTTAYKTTGYPRVVANPKSIGWIGDSNWLRRYFSSIQFSYAPMKWFVWSYTEEVLPYDGQIWVENGVIDYISNENALTILINTEDTPYVDSKYTIFDVIPEEMRDISYSKLVPDTGTAGIFIDNYGMLTTLMQNFTENNGFQNIILSVNINAAETVHNIITRMKKEVASDGVPFEFTFANLLYAKKMAYTNNDEVYSPEHTSFNYYNYVRCSSDGSTSPSIELGFVTSQEEDYVAFQQWYLPCTIAQNPGDGSAYFQYNECPYFMADSVILDDGFMEGTGTHVFADYVE